MCTFLNTPLLLYLWFLCFHYSYAVPEGWVDPGGWLIYTEMVYLSADSHPSYILAVTTGSRTHKSRPFDRKSSVRTIMPQGHLDEPVISHEGWKVKGQQVEP